MRSGMRPFDVPRLRMMILAGREERSFVPAFLRMPILAG